LPPPELKLLLPPLDPDVWLGPELNVCEPELPPELCVELPLELRLLLPELKLWLPLEALWLGLDEL
jgi:hypothetical protein